VWFTTAVARHINYLWPTILVAEQRNYAKIGVIVPDARDTCRLVSYRYAKQKFLLFFRNLGFKNWWVTIQKL